MSIVAIRQGSTTQCSTSLLRLYRQKTWWRCSSTPCGLFRQDVRKEKRTATFYLCFFPLSSRGRQTSDGDARHTWVCGPRGDQLRARDPGDGHVEHRSHLLHLVSPFSDSSGSWTEATLTHSKRQRTDPQWQPGCGVSSRFYFIFLPPSKSISFLIPILF